MGSENVRLKSPLLHNNSKSDVSGHCGVVGLRRSLAPAKSWRSGTTSVRGLQPDTGWRFVEYRYSAASYRRCFVTVKPATLLLHLLCKSGHFNIYFVFLIVVVYMYITVCLFVLLFVCVSAYLVLYRLRHGIRELQQKRKRTLEALKV